MLRISNLLRGRIPMRIPVRAGLPNWDRPDPPPSVVVETDHELSDQQIVFTFFDRNMPQFFITQPEVYEGDTLTQAAPSLLKGWGVIFAVASLFGLSAYLINPEKSFTQPSQQTINLAQKTKKAIQNKQYFKWGSQNELGIELSYQNYPPLKPEINERVRKGLARALQKHHDYEKTNKEVQSYLKNLKLKAEDKVNKRLTAIHTDHNQDHGQHQESHNEGNNEVSHEHMQQHKQQH